MSARALTCARMLVLGLWVWLSLLHQCKAASAVSDSGLDLCSQSFCKCPEAGKQVICSCTNTSQAFTLDGTSLPKQAEMVHLANCGSVTISTNTFAHCLDLKELVLELHYKELANLTVSFVGRVELDDNAFANFPKTSRATFAHIGLPRLGPKGLDILTDSFVMSFSTIGRLEQSSVYSDAVTLTFEGNRIEDLATGAFDASVRRFRFVDNTLDAVSHMSFSVAALDGIIAGNTFHSIEGSPFVDFGPDPVCVPDPEAEWQGDGDEGDEDMAYVDNVVANPTLDFSDNVFHTFTQEMLDFPGANNVPLASLRLKGNKVKCDCNELRDFVALVDYEDIFDDDTSDGDDKMSLGALLFRKEFFDTGLCLGTDNERLKAFARRTISLAEGRGRQGQAGQGRKVLMCSERSVIPTRDEENPRTEDVPGSTPTPVVQAHNVGDLPRQQDQPLPHQQHSSARRWPQNLASSLSCSLLLILLRL